MQQHKPSKYLDFDKIKLQLPGNWHLIFSALVAGYDPNLFERAGRKHGPCPICEGTDRFQFFKDAHETGGAVCRGCGSKSDGIRLVMDANGWSYADAMKSINAVINGEELEELDPVRTQDLNRLREESRKRTEEKRRKQAAEDKFLRQLLKDTWQETYPADAPEAAPMRRYMSNRGLTVEEWPPTLRFHPGLQSTDEDGVLEGVFPAMVALVVDRDGTPVTLHRTFLTEDGQKAPVQSAKKLMPYPSDRELSGGAIHLSGTGRVINVTEGIETGFAVKEMVGGSIWITVNASMMANLQVGEPVEAVWVWGDLDRSGDGQKAARALVDRVREEGRQATPVIPNVAIPAGEKSVDWLDMYLHWFESHAADKARFVARSQRRAAA